MKQYFRAAEKLHNFIETKHWNGQALIGPDPGIRFNYRIGRFIKSYLHKIAWNDGYYYLQAQSYWVLGNWALFTHTGDSRYREIALRCSEYMLTRQRNDGTWDYPNAEWKGRVATVEGTWGSIGLLETYRHTADPIFMEGALRWHEFMVNNIKFQGIGEELAINYFADRGDVRVPNNSTTVLGFLAELAAATDEVSYLEPRAGLLSFIKKVQMSTGEIPYAVGGLSNPSLSRPHFQCYQYNAFECLILIRYYELTRDRTVLPVITKLLEFLRKGLAEDGHAYYDCGKPSREIIYHTAALGAAFTMASQLGLEGYDELAERAYAYLLRLQKSDGGFIHSQRDYSLLTDQRSYPRYLAMILYHLLFRNLKLKTNLALNTGSPPKARY